MGKSKFMKDPITTSQDLSLGALSYTTTMTQAFQLEEINFHFSADVTETITITLDSYQGANYDTVLRTIDVVEDNDAVYKPDPKSNYHAGDNIKINVSNANGVGVCYAEIITSELS
jgi:hypothetical protein